MLDDGLYSTNYINILSTAMPTTLILTNSSEYQCKEQCNNNSKCTGYTYSPTYSLTCLSTAGPIDASTCTRTNGIQAGPTSVNGTTYSLTCLSTASPIDASTCTKTNGLQAGEASVSGNCYTITESDSKNVPNPLYVKNQCSSYKNICSTIWSTHFTVFEVVISLFLVLNIYLMYLCLRDNSKFYRNLDKKMIIYTMLALAVLGAIISALVIKFG